MKISIIIPVYNTETYLPTCLDSCLHQNLATSQYEIILVNDGSSDDSEKICRDYESSHPHVSLHSFRTNRGQSAARNLGMTKARGEYVWFIDSDDSVQENSLQKICGFAEDGNLDILAFNGLENSEEMDRSQPINHQMSTEQQMTGKDYLFNHDPTTCTPLYLFSRAFLQNRRLTFHPGVFFEDEEFIYKSLYLCNGIGFLQDCLYFISQRQDSTTRGNNPKKAYDLLAVAKELSVFTRNTVAPQYQSVFHSRIALLLNKALLYSLSLDKDEAEKWAGKLGEQKSLFGHLRKSRAIKDRLEGILFTLFPGQAAKLFKIIHGK